MVNIMRMDLYRLVHGKSLWIFLAAIAALAAMGAGMMGVVTDPAFMESMAMSYTNGAPAGVNIGFSSSGPDASDLAEANAAVAMLAQGLSPEALIGNVFLGGGGLACSSSSSPYSWHRSSRAVSARTCSPCSRGALRSWGRARSKCSCWPRCSRHS